MGRKPESGRGHPDFAAYQRAIVEHPAYAGMPDLRGDGGEIQWEVPSNRGSGKFKDTYLKRLNWWREKARTLGVQTTESHWISKVAKRIHPTQRKVCKKCGRELDLRYVYPSRRTLERLEGMPIASGDFAFAWLEPIDALVARLHDAYGDAVFAQLAPILRTSAQDPSSLPPELGAWQDWLQAALIPSEPRGLLSPGAMSNAPDRLDGFHSFNLCCRAKADPGRSEENLRAYATDRRVFEYWVDGDWVAADRLMGLVRSRKTLREAACANGHPGPCDADHIGPISLGFSHRPAFRLLCGPCNSAKNNRLTSIDVALLRDAEAAGEAVVSWYARPLWDRVKGRVSTPEEALRLSKLLRDNRHTYMDLLWRVRQEGRLLFLAGLLDLARADQDVAFEGLRIEDSVTVFAASPRTPRGTKYAREQKARRLRVAFDALEKYRQKASRNAYLLWSDAAEGRVRAGLGVLQAAAAVTGDLDQRIARTLSRAAEHEGELRDLVPAVEAALEQAQPQLSAAKALFSRAMALVAEELAARWSDERYFRGEAELNAS